MKNKGVEASSGKNIRYVIGVDVGGTFTDVVVAGHSDPLYLKVPTQSDAQASGIHDGIAAAAGRLGLSSRELLACTERIVHGTTVATNMMLEGDGSRVGLITTAGFRDDLEYRRGLKEAIYDPRLPAPRPLIRRRFRKTVAERISANGSVITPLGESAVRKQIRELRKAGCESLTVAFLFSFLEDAHERRVRDIALEEWPEVYLSLSSEILPQVREYERFSTTAVNAYVGPKTARYLKLLGNELRESGFAGELLLIQSSGGVVDVGYASLRPVSLLLSGPAGGVLAATEMLAKRTSHRNLITVDMGGTSFDVCLIADATPHVTSETYIERHAVALPMIGIHTIGAGGGSIARVDKGGVLRVGPASAGSTPGPACYGRGGTLPTVTDANLVLGFLNPAATLGGSVVLDIEAARGAIQHHIAEPLGLSWEAAAQGIIRMVDSHMTNGTRVVSVQQGHDPRDFALVAFGGNGAVHAGRLAEELEMETILVPRMAGAFSAWGGLCADARVDNLMTWIGRCDDLDTGALEQVIDTLMNRGTSALSVSGLIHEAQLGCHYLGQTSEIWVPLKLDGGHVSKQAILESAEAFHKAHERERSFANWDESVHIIGIKVTSRHPYEQPLEAVATKSNLSALASGSTREVYFNKDAGWQATPIYEGSALSCADSIDGPAIVEEPETTIVVHPGWNCRLDDTQVYHLTRKGKAA